MLFQFMSGVLTCIDYCHNRDCAFNKLNRIAHVACVWHVRDGAPKFGYRSVFFNEFGRFFALLQRYPTIGLRALTGNFG